MTSASGFPTSPSSDSTLSLSDSFTEGVGERDGDCGAMRCFAATLFFAPFLFGMIIKFSVNRTNDADARPAHPFGLGQDRIDS